MLSLLQVSTAVSPHDVLITSSFGIVQVYGAPLGSLLPLTLVNRHLNFGKSVNILPLIHILLCVVYHVHTCIIYYQNYPLTLSVSVICHVLYFDALGLLSALTISLTIEKLYMLCAPSK